MNNDDLLDVFLLMPDTTRANRMTAPPGWHVHVSLEAIFDELEQTYAERVRKWGGRSKDPHAPWKVVPVKNRIPRVHTRYNSIRSECLLLEPTCGWKRVDRDDYLLWEVDRVMNKRKIDYHFRDIWLPMLPDSSRKKPEPVIMTR